MKKGVFFITILLLILVPLVNAQPPATIQTNVNLEFGLDIDFPKITVLELNKSFELNLHVFNRSDGLPLDNTTVNCSYHLFNKSGNHILINSNIPYDSINGDWSEPIGEGNFSVLGDYYILVDCRTSSFGGFASFPLTVTQTGNSLDTPESIVYLILVIGALFFFLLSLYGGIALPFKNKRNKETGKIVGIEMLKYFKLALLSLSYILFVWLANLLFALANNSNILTPYTKFFEVIFIVINSLGLAVFVTVFVAVLFLGWRDLNLKKLLDRGISPR